MRDLRHALRLLKKSPVVSCVAILTIALGVGANVAIFSVVKAVLLNQLPYRDPDRLVKIAVADSDSPVPETIDFTTTYDLRQRSRLFQSMSLFRDGEAAFVELGHSELLPGLRVSHDYFDTLGVDMHLGRSFLAEEDHADTRYEAILSYGLWLRRFGADPTIIGRTVQFSGRTYKVVGVLSESFHPIVRSIPSSPCDTNSHAALVFRHHI